MLERFVAFVFGEFPHKDTFSYENYFIQVVKFPAKKVKRGKSY